MTASLIPLLLADLFIVGVLAIVYQAGTRRGARLQVFVEHLAGMARQRLPLQTGLRVLAHDMGGVMGIGLVRVARHVEDGLGLGEAFEKSPLIFPPFLRRMIVMGENSGNLAGFIEELSRSYGRTTETRRSSTLAILYPLAICVFLGMLIAFLGEVVRPRIESISSAIALGEPPWLFRTWPWIVTAHQAVLTLTMVLAVAIALGSSSPLCFPFPLRRLKSGADRLLLGLPAVGNLVRKGSLRCFSLSAGLLLRAGASLPEAVRATAESEPNTVLRRWYVTVADRVEEGRRLAECCRNAGPFPEGFAWFVEAGEASGALAEHLLQAAAHYDEKARVAGQVVFRSIVPILVLLNGIVVLAVYAPSFLFAIDVLRAVTGSVS